MRSPWPTPERVIQFLWDLACRHVVAVFCSTATGGLTWFLTRSVVLSMGLSVLVLLSLYVMSYWYSQPVDPHDRGRRETKPEEAKRKAVAARAPNDRGVFFGETRIPTTDSPTHILVVGGTGSGKTMSLRLLYQDVLPTIVPGSDCRAMIYDAKQDTLSHLAGMGIQAPVAILNPFDTRSVACDMSADITSPVTAFEIASILIPEEVETNRFFSDAARDLLSGVLEAFILRHPGRWTFRDVVLALTSRKDLRKVLHWAPTTRQREDYFEPESAFASILATVHTKMAPFRAIPGCWHRAKAKISLADWVSGSYIVVLGHDEAIKAALAALNRVIFKRASELVLAQKASSTRKTWVFIDELREAGRLDGLSSLVVRGRSNGVCLCVAFQSIRGIREVYTDKVAQEIVGQFAHKVFLRCDDPESAKWFCDAVGEFERRELQKSITVSGNGQSTTFGEHLVKRELYLSSEFLDMPMTNRENGMYGVYLSPFTGVFRSVLSEEFLEKALCPRDPTFPDFIPRPDEHYQLPPWTEEERRRLGLDDVDDDDQEPEEPDGPRLPDLGPRPR